MQIRRSAVQAGESQAAAEKLYTYGLFKGGAYGFNLNGTTTKAEAAAMVVRLLGGEDDAYPVHIIIRTRM